MPRKGPGRAARQGISLAQLFEMFPDDAAAERWFVTQRWGDAPYCPHCGSFNVQSGAAHKTMPYRCRDCRKRFSVRTATVMERSNLGYQTWAIAVYLLTTSLKGVSSMKLHRDLGITQKSAWHLAHRIRRAWARPGRPFAGPVEADETFMGGKEGNKHAAKRRLAAKAIVAGVKDRASNRVRAQVVPDTTTTTLRPFVRSHTAPYARIYTDDAASYRGLPNHATVRHSVGEYVRGQIHTNGLESFWASLKRGYYGTYHHMSPKHLQRYVTEFAGRHNDRPADTIEQMRRLARGMLGKRLSYRELIGTS